MDHDRRIGRLRVDQGKAMTGVRTSDQGARPAVRRQRDMAMPSARPGRIWSRRLSLLASSLLVTGCTHMFGGDGGPGPAAPPVSQPAVESDAQPIAPPAVPPATPPSAKVAILLPLSGPNGGLGAVMLRAAKLAVTAPGAPALDAHDTAGPAGAAEAARLAIRSGDTMILGPLTSGDTAEVAPVAQAASVPVLAFTSDVAQARPGVWVMGVTPEQQVRRLVFAAKDDGRSRIAALLPANGLGDALAAGLTRACADAGLPPPTILTHAGTPDSITATMKQLADFDHRTAMADQQTKDAAAAAAAAAPPAATGPTAADPAPSLPAAPPAAGGTAAQAPGPVAGAATALPPPSAPLPPPPFDALLLGDTGLQLQEMIQALHQAGVSAPQVRIMGPTLWAAFASKLHALAGAWYAAPDPAARLGFAQQYRAAYGQGAKPLADIPYDAAALARSLAPGYQSDALTRSDGFAGVDGVFALQPDGHVHRALAIFQIQPGGGGIIVQPAPRSFSGGTS